MITITGDLRLSKDFTLREFSHCISGSKYEIVTHDDFYIFVNALQEFRDWYNRPINISSGYRSPLFNTLVGGSVNSSHKVTLAIDFTLPLEFFKLNLDDKIEFYQNVREKWITICRKYNKGCQCNFYDTYIHIGFSLNKQDSFIDKRKLYK